MKLIGENTPPPTPQQKTQRSGVREAGGGLCQKLKEMQDSIPVRRSSACEAPGARGEEGRAWGLGRTLFTSRAPGDPDPLLGQRAQSLVRSVPWSGKPCLAMHRTLDTLRDTHETHSGRHTQGHSGTLREARSARHT